MLFRFTFLTWLLSLLVFALLFCLYIGTEANFGSFIGFLLLIFLVSAVVSLPLWIISDWIFRRLITDEKLETFIYATWVLLTAFVIYAGPALFMMLSPGGMGELVFPLVPAAVYVVVAIARYYFFLRVLENWRSVKADGPLEILSASLNDQNSHS